MRSPPIPSENYSIMKKLLEFIASSIVQNPKEISVDEQVNNDLTTLTVHSHPEDIKILIGKGGQTIKALRTLLRTKALLKKQKVDLKIEG